MLKKFSRVLAIGAHPDDIEIGCGGSLAKWSQLGTKTYMCVFSSGEIGGNSQVRHREQEESAIVLGVTNFFLKDYHDTNIPNNKKIINDIETIIKEINPEIILVHHRDDTHQDHRNLAKATIIASRNRKNILFYESPTSFNFSPNVFVNIERTVETKRRALTAHKSQIDKTNIEGRNILQIALGTSIFRGVEGRVKYAEGFMPLRVFI